MAGAVAVIGDLLKTDAWDLALWINHHHDELGFASPPIPQRTIDKPPSAELRPDQIDEDSLPPYELLDEIIRGYVEQEHSAARITAETGIDARIVQSITLMIDRTQFKREQAAVIPKLSRRAFGRGRVMPIVMRSTAT
jgi:NAD+ synthase (glutamine-hydrolysing)